VGDTVRVHTEDQRGRQGAHQISKRHIAGKRESDSTLPSGDFYGFVERIFPVFSPRIER